MFESITTVYVPVNLYDYHRGYGDPDYDVDDFNEEFGNRLQAALGAFFPDADVEVAIVDDGTSGWGSIYDQSVQVNGEIADSSTAGGYPFVDIDTIIDRTLGVA